MAEIHDMYFKQFYKIWTYKVEDDEGKLFSALAF